MTHRLRRDPDTAVLFKCEVCGAQPGQPCRNTIRPGQPLPGRETHHARYEAEIETTAMHHTEPAPKTAVRGSWGPF